MAHGARCGGPNRCFYCGAACGVARPAAEYVRDSFTGRDSVVAPGSPWVCEGCVLCLRDAADVTLVTGETRHMDRIAVRAWSWLVTPDAALAASKAHLDALRASCLNGLSPAPWAVVLSDSGQKHLLYRGRVNFGPPPWVVTLEGEPITYRPESLAARLALCGKLVAATGKPALAEPVSWRFAAAVIGRYDDGEALISEWSQAREEPLSRLAAWLSPNKETCDGTYFPTASAV